MPKAPVNENGQLPIFDNNIGGPWESSVCAVPDSGMPEIGPQSAFRAGVGLSDFRHHFTTFLQRPDVGHQHFTCSGEASFDRSQSKGLVATSFELARLPL